LAVASVSRSNAAFLSLRLIAVAQASSSVCTTRRIDTAVFSLLNMSPDPVGISKIEILPTPKPTTTTLKRLALKPFRLFAVARSRRGLVRSRPQYAAAGSV
jgi:hypothetical protein